MFYGLAVDCGTSNLSLSLCRKGRPEQRRDLTAKNPCLRFGADVITRAANAEKNENVRRLLVEELWQCVAEGAKTLCEQEGVRLTDVRRISFCANPILTHLSLGLVAVELTRFPFSLKNRFLNFKQSAPFDLSRFGFHRRTRLFVAPLVSAFVGGDVLLGFADDETDEPSHFYADLGTNGEMILKTPRGLFAASCAAGPAFEGGLVRCGMRAEEGAVEHAEYQDGAFVLDTVGGQEARGLCVGGLVEVLLAAFDAGLLSPNGEVKNEPLCIAENLTLTTEEVRAVLLAKAAFRAGARVLFSAANTSYETLCRFTLAGALGEHLNRQKAAEFGLFDPELLRLAKPKQNAALEGAARALWDRAFRRRCTTLARSTRSVDLASDPSFNETYVNSISF